jgi:hypothetical protein
MKEFNNILPASINQNIIKTLLYSPNWQFAEDDDKPAEIGVFDNKVNHAAFILTSYDIFKNINRDNILNLYAETITALVCEKAEVKNYTIQRFCWNYYMPGMSGNYHTDNDNDNRISILYSLNTTDGGFYLGDEFYPDVMGTAKVFKSNIKHKGVGPKNDKARFNLNTVIMV